MRSAAQRVQSVRESFAPKSVISSEKYCVAKNSHTIFCVLRGEEKTNTVPARDNRASAETLSAVTNVTCQSPQSVLGSASDTQHTLAHVRCLACAESFGLQIELDPSIQFRDAAPRWLESRKPRLARGSIEDYEKNILRLNQFFGEMRLQDIGIANIAAYQKDRIVGRYPFTRKAGPSRINHETMTLGQIMGRAGLWKKLAEYFEPLPIPRKKKGKALTEEEEVVMFEIAESLPKCKIACCVWTITANTTAHWSEVTNLRLQNICLLGSPIMPLGYIHIEEGIKNEYRERNIPLNPSARKAVDFLLTRAKRFGATKPEHYLIPDRFGNPSKPMSTCKKAWYTVRAKLVERFPHLAKLRQYDLRHHALTKLLESGEISESTAEEIAGHIPGDMKKLYSHPRMKAKAAAVMVLQRKMVAGA